MDLLWFALFLASLLAGIIFWRKYVKIKKDLDSLSDRRQQDTIAILRQSLDKEQHLNEELAQREEELTANEEELRQSLESQRCLLEEIQRKEASLKALINNTDDLIFSFDKNFCIVDFNRTAQEFYTSKGARFERGAHMSEFVTPKNMQHARQILEGVLRGECHSTVFDIIDKNGAKNFYDSKYNPIWNEYGEVIGMSVMIREITDRIKAMETLQASEEKYAKAFKSSPDAVMITSVSSSRILEFNEGFLAWSGYTREEVEGRSTIELGFWNLEERNYLKQQLHEHGRLLELEVHLKIKSGEVRDCLMSAETIMLNGELCFVSITRDVTYKKKNQELLIELLNSEKQLNYELSQREEELTSSEEELRQSFESQSRLLAEIQLKEANVSALMNNTNDLIYSVDKEYCVIEFNTPMFCFNKDRGIKMVKGMHVTEFVDEANVKDSLETLNKAMKGETRMRTFEVMVKNEMQYYEGNYHPIINEQEQVLGVSIVLRNVTERKKAEDALRASEEKYSIWFRSNPDSMVVSTVEEGIIIDANNSFLDNLDLKIEDVIGKRTSELGFMRDLYARDELRDQVLKHGVVTNWELRTVRKSDPKSTVLVSCASFDIGGKKCMITTSRDITQMRKAEEEARISNERLKVVIDNIPVAIWSLDKDGIITLSEGKALQDMGLKPGQHVGESVYDVYKNNPEQTVYVKPVLEDGVTHRKTDRIGEGYYEEIVVPLRNNNGAIIGLIGVSFDITEVMKKENKLRENEALLNNIIDHLPIGLQIFDREGYSVKMNEAQRNLLGLKSKADGVGKFNALNDPINTFIGAHALFDKAFNGEIVDNVELKVDFGKLVDSRYSRTDLAWFNLWLFPLFDKRKKVVAIINLLSEITERKLSEQEIEQKQTELMEVNKMMADYKLMALRSAMNPHFIFNAMNSIQYFISKNERENALIYLSLFSKLIRNILNGTVENKISIHHEMETLQNYIELENLRFDTKFEVEYVLDESLDVRQIEIPSLLLQPYVENAILHGLYNKPDKGKLRIEIISHNENTVIFVIEDNGVGREAARKIKQANQINHKSVGMVLTKERLDIINKTNNISVEITDLTDKEGKAAGTRIEIHVEI
ncbi:MAG TPA: PAS domain S-box protein [Cytophagaceae bacterium]|nr:PAS domain S-box protein [Cytophagaceae bacterium]